MKAAVPPHLLWSVAAALAVAVFWTATILSYPPPSCDETTYASAGVSILERGSVALTLFPAGSVTGRDVNAVQFGRSYEFGLAGLFAAFGVSLTTARAYSLAGWAAAVALAGLLGRQCFDPPAGLAGAFLFATGSKVFLAAHLARPEMWTAAAILLAALAGVTLIQHQSSPAWLAFAAGLAAVWPGDFHLLGFAFTFGLTAALVWEMGLRRRQLETVAWFGLGLAAGLGVWLWVRQLNGDWSGLRQLEGVSLAPLQSTSAGGRWLANLATLPGWFYSVFWTAAGPLSLAEAGLALLGIGLVWRSPDPAGRFLVATALGALVVFGAGTGIRWIQYGVLWSPFWILPGAAGALRLARRAAEQSPYRAARLIGPFVIAGLVTANLAGDGWLAYRFRGSDYTAIGAELNALVPAGSRVLADPVWWWALRPGRTFMSEDYVSLVRLAAQPAVQQFLNVGQGASVEGALAALRQKLRPDYVVVDGAVGCQTDPGELSAAYAADIEEACRRIGQVEGAWLSDPARFAVQIGPVARVYQCEPQ